VLQSWTLPNPIPSGSAGNPTILNAYNGETVTMNNALNGGGNSNWIAFENFSGYGYTSFLGHWVLDGSNMVSSTNQQAVFFGTGTHHIVIDGMEIKNMRNNTGFAGNGSFIEIRNCKVHDTNLDGASALSYGMYINTNNSIIEHCQVYNNGAYGIHNYHATANDVTNNQIRFNEFWNNSVNGIGYHAAGLITSSGDNNQIYGNVFHDNPYDGIELDDDCTNCKIYNNTIYNSGVSGISPPNSNPSGGTIIKNNILVNNGTNIFNNFATFSNNLCFGTGGTSNCQIIGQNPLFVDPAAGDFHLQSSSPAINAGATLGAPYDKDFDGVQRPVGTAYDIGAYEYGGTVTPPPPPPTAPTSGTPPLQSQPPSEPLSTSSPPLKNS
jgi:parallel beta-helix repeat protein